MNSLYLFFFTNMNFVNLDVDSIVFGDFFDVYGVSDEDGVVFKDLRYLVLDVGGVVLTVVGVGDCFSRCA